VPTLGGVQAVHLYSVPGIVRNNGLNAAFSCTSASTSPMRVGVEVFPAAGGGPLNNADTTSLLVPPGGTVIFVVNTLTGLSYDMNLGIAAALGKGSARIVSTSKSLICTAMLLDETSSPPISMTYLTVVKKAKQKAAN